jgi:hypothetical protein
MWISATASSTWPKQLAEKSIRRSRWIRLYGRKHASLIGGGKAANGGVVYAAQTAVSSGSGLLIFVPRAAHSHSLEILGAVPRVAQADDLAGRDLELVKGLARGDRRRAACGRPLLQVRPPPTGTLRLS